MGELAVLPIRPEVGSKWLYKDYNVVAYIVHSYYDDDNVVCEFDVGNGIQRSFPFPWRDLLKYHRPGLKLIRE